MTQMPEPLVIDEPVSPERLLQLVNEATAPVTGDDFFRSLVGRLAELLGVDSVLLTECQQQPSTWVRTRAYWHGGGFIEDISFDVIGTPCEDVVDGGRFCFYPRGLHEVFPEWSAEEGGVESFIGIPVYGKDNQAVIGHIAIFDHAPMEEERVVESVFRIIAARAGAELQRLQIEAALRASEEKYRLLVENQSDMIVKTDPTGNLLFASPSFCRALGFREEDLVGTLFPPLAACPELQQQWVALSSATREARFEAALQSVDGEQIVAWTARAVPLERFAGGCFAVVASGRDVTDQRQAENAARMHLQELAQVSRRGSMGEMASALAHELNQPLTSIVSYAQACRRLLQRDDDVRTQVLEGVDRILATADRATGIVRSLRQYVKQRKGEQVSRDLRALIDEAAHLLKSQSRHAGARLSLDIPDDLPAVHVDGIQIQQVLMNLVRNGLEAMVAAPLRGQPVIEIRARNLLDEGVVLEVRDNGPGIAPEMAETLFDPFTTSKEDGMGIGLSLCRSIIREHGGELRADNAPEGGAVFRITLPPVTET